MSALFSVLMILLCFVAVSSTQHELHWSERERLDAALEFVRGYRLKHGVTPDSAEFDAWTHEMDLKGFRFEGNGFALDKRCGSEASQFCFYFSTGNGFVTYKSWQKSTENVNFDESPLPWALGFLVAGLAAAVLSKLLFAPPTNKKYPRS